MGKPWSPAILCLFLYTSPTVLAKTVASGNAFSQPKSPGLDSVNLYIGTTGTEPNKAGGMIPSVAPPFGMTRWVAQTQVSYVSATPYNASWALEGGKEHNEKIHGFMGTRQPAIWMGESGSIAVVPGVIYEEPDGGVNLEDIRTEFESRGLKVVSRNDPQAVDYGREEVVTPSYYSVLLDDGLDGRVFCEMSATSRVGHVQFTFSNPTKGKGKKRPYILIEAARPSIITSTPTNVTYPPGYVKFTPSTPQGQPRSDEQKEQPQLEVCGYSTERQDSIITPVSGQAAASQFKGYFCARLNFPSAWDPTSTTTPPSSSSPISYDYGVIQNGTAYPGKQEASGPVLSAYVFLPDSNKDSDGVVDIRVGTSFISIEQARANLDSEIPSDVTTGPSEAAQADNDHEGDEKAVVGDAKPGTLEWTARGVRSEWAELLGRMEIEVGGEDDKEAEVMKQVFWTGVVHSLQYPSEQHEANKYWSGAIWALQILLVPERIPGMVRSMLQDYQQYAIPPKQSGWLPMWKNIVETNIMVGTHADSLIAEAVLKNVSGLNTHADRELAWEAVWKDCSVPPVADWEREYGDREEFVDYEVRAGLSSVYNVPGKGWVADDVHSESASRTLDYAYDDFAAYTLAKLLKKPRNILVFLYVRAMNVPFNLFNDETGFMEARNQDGSWAGEDKGWTEGDKWAYSFDVVHNVPELIRKRGGRVNFVKSLEEHFEGGHNDHTNEPSHHIPYLYALSGAAFKTQERVREIAKENYGNLADGLTGNEDCGQMSAWYIFSAMGFYPINPVSGEYVVGSPFFEHIRLNLPNPSITTTASSTAAPIAITISAPGASTKPYVRSLTVNGVRVNEPVIKHEQLVAAGGDGNVEVVFEMSETVEGWGNDREVLAALGVWGAGKGEWSRDEL
ncbi:hypothetical protein EST38_g9162 [Candolleomyces aberdarensis]|uniref:Glycoside hydrolase family 92 protein n=1 Tax=Candolleomyces aberdarensis TaxID=2316362 RepID=A0A4Q2DAM6_9AGAR|nr:hypothetical protein EST38_g9162 [Candolleomyces aberdarensis]